MRFSTLAKMVTGSVDKDQLAELLSSIGVEASMTPIDPSMIRAEFQSLWTAASLLPADAMVLKARMKDGATLTGILVSKGPSNNSEIPSEVTKEAKNKS